MRALRLTPAQLSEHAPAALAGAVLLAEVQLRAGTLAKGTRLDPEQVTALQAGAQDGSLAGSVPLAWLEADELHEDEAAWRLARAVAGSGVVVGVPRENRVELTAERAGVLHVNVEPLSRLNRIDPIAVFTLYDGTAVRAGEVVGAVKVGPCAVSVAIVRKGEAFATGHTRLVQVAPYLPLEVGAVVTDPIDDDAFTRFDAAVRAKVTGLGGTLADLVRVTGASAAEAETKIRNALEHLLLQRRLPMVIVTGASIDDPLSPVFAALDALGGQLLRHGVPAHPGSMIWLAELSGGRILGLPRAGGFAGTTAADLLFPRLMTGEALTAESLAELGHGGLIGAVPRPRFPDYGRGRPGTG